MVYLSSSSTRGIIHWRISTSSPTGRSLTNTIEFITIATEGNATDFGDLNTGIVENGGVQMIQEDYYW